jgi:cysteine dioxygenase
MVESRTVSSETLEHIRMNDSEIDDLILWLESIEGRPGLEALGNKLQSLDIDVDSLRKSIQSNPDDYCRNILFRSSQFELVVIIWRPGQDTPIHDHVGSDCAFLILHGESTETIYELNSEGFAFPISSRVYRPGEVCAAEEPDIHRVSNDGDSELINLHVYTPPLHAFKIYDSNG